LNGGLCGELKIDDTIKIKGHIIDFELTVESLQVETCKG
jgi:hypothetical protein